MSSPLCSLFIPLLSLPFLTILSLIFIIPMYFLCLYFLSLPLHTYTGMCTCLKHFYKRFHKIHTQFACFCCVTLCKSLYIYLISLGLNLFICKRGIIILPRRGLTNTDKVLSTVASINQHLIEVSHTHIIIWHTTLPFKRLAKGNSSCLTWKLTVTMSVFSNSYISTCSMWHRTDQMQMYHHRLLEHTCDGTDMYIHTPHTRRLTMWQELTGAALGQSISPIHISEVFWLFSFYIWGNWGTKRLINCQRSQS